MPIQLAYCGLDEADELQAFIRDQWSANHILTHRAFLDWQHRDDEKSRYNFLLARDSGGQIIGMLGFIPTSRYDPSLAGTADTVWLTTWKANDRAHGVGLLLLRALMAQFRPAWIGTVGLNPATLGIYKTLGYRTGKLTRYFLLNDAISPPRLAVIPHGLAKVVPCEGTTAFVPLTKATFWDATSGYEFGEQTHVPRRTLRYIFNRFLCHPFYEYRVFLAARPSEIHATIVTVRLCRYEDATALRVVDLLASPETLSSSGPAFRTLIMQSSAEYLDLYCSTFRSELQAAGFRDAADVKDLILPGYFEPYQQTNVELLYSLLGPEGSVAIFKGDADQDRPSQLQVGQNDL